MSSSVVEPPNPLPPSDDGEIGGKLNAQSKTFYNLFVEMKEGQSPVFPKDIDEKIANLPNHLQRVDLVHKYVVPVIEKHVLGTERNTKDDIQSVFFLEKGYKKNLEREFLDALEYFTNCIQFAKTSKVSALAYDRRSQLFFERELRRECLADIERALEYDCSDELKKKLEDRRALASELMICVQPYHGVVPTCVEPNTKIQCASKCIQITSCPKYGRQIVATENIKPGRLLVVEKPFSTKIVSGEFQHCHECFKLCYDLIPCDFCTNTLYCKKSCKNKAFKTYHQYECIVLAYGRKLGLVLNDMWALKLTITTRTMRPLSSQQEELYKSDRYYEIINLHDVTKNAKKESLTMWVTCCCFIYHLVKYYTDYFDGPGKRQFEDQFKERLVKHVGICFNNPLPVVELRASKTAPIYHFKESGLGLYAFSSLFNHSCQPNITIMSYGTTLVLRSLSSIKKGEQCFLSYGIQHDTHALEQRQSVLLKRYHFTCDCRACEENWPQMDDLEPKTPHYTTSEGPLFIRECLQETDCEKANELLPQVIRNLQKVEKFTPCLEVAFLKRALEHCYRLYGNVKKQF